MMYLTKRCYGTWMTIKKIVKKSQDQDLPKSKKIRWKSLVFPSPYRNDILLASLYNIHYNHPRTAQIIFTTSAFLSPLLNTSLPQSLPPWYHTVCGLLPAVLLSCFLHSFKSRGTVTYLPTARTSVPNKQYLLSLFMIVSCQVRNRRALWYSGISDSIVCGNNKVPTIRHRKGTLCERVLWNIATKPLCNISLWISRTLYISVPSLPILYRQWVVLGDERGPQIL